MCELMYSLQPKQLRIPEAISQSFRAYQPFQCHLIFRQLLNINRKALDREKPLLIYKSMDEVIF